MGRTVDSYEGAVDLVSDLAKRYQISGIRSFLESCRQRATRSDLNVAVLGRFKAGKSSFLNHLIGRDILPVGVIPVTSVVTELSYGPLDLLEIKFADGREIRVPIADLAAYVSEAENPHNRKHVLKVWLQVPELLRWHNIRFIDTPGLESTFAHNTEVSLNWAPNVDIALVAVGVDPPLTQQDIELISKLTKYTPRIAVLLTKMDILSRSEQGAVMDFVRKQLSQRFKMNISVHPYSIRAGYAQFSLQFKEQFLSRIADDVISEGRAITKRKIISLLAECEDYVRLSLKSSEMLDSERLELQERVSAEIESLADTKLNIQLVARNATGRTRQSIERALASQERVIRKELLEAFSRESSSFPKGFSSLLEHFEQWLNAALSSKLSTISGAKRNELLQPLIDVQRQYQRLMQTFRDRLSERTMALYGVPLRTSEPEIRPEPPKMPDVKVGRVFDHNWELLSPLIPMYLLRRAVLRRFRQKIGDETFKNLSRLTAQWVEIVTAAIIQLEHEAENRIEDLLSTVEQLTSTPQRDFHQIEIDIRQLQEMTRSFLLRD